ncbi:MAG: permease prefix domain 1-containing protein [Chloroflexota bacterium]
MSAEHVFLAEVAAELPLPEDRRAEVLEELAAHLGDAVADMVARGYEPAKAEAEALNRLGSPTELARALVRAQRSRGHVLAAAGAGTWAAIRTGLPSAFLAWVLVTVVTIFATALVRAVGDRLGLQVGPAWGGGSNTVMAGFGLAVGAFLGGAAAVRVVALRSWHAPREVRVAVALTGALVLAYAVLVRLETALTPAGLIALMLVPAAFIAGARFEHLRLRTTRIAGLFALAGVVALGVSIGVAGGGGANSYSWSEETHGYEMIAPWWQDPAAGPATDFPSGGSIGSTGVEMVTLYAASPAAVGRFHDFRLEAWRAEMPQDGWSLVPGQTVPFATAPASVDGAAISGTIAFNQAPGVEWAEVVMTAVGPDGKRYLLSASGPERTEFYGSVLSWLAATDH